MSHSGVNKATTEDGATYNKLRRPDDYLHSLTAPPPPPTKRKFDAVEVEDEQETEAPNNKRSREGHDLSREAKPQAGANETARGGNANNGARANPRAPIVGDMRRVARPAKENGMHTMFPGLDDDSASDADDTTRDALAYLRSVRSEASTIPTLLVAPPQPDKDGERDRDRDRSAYGNGGGDNQVVYQDGTWVAVDHDAAGDYYEEEWYDDEEDMDPQDAYYKGLLARYDSLRSTLAAADPKKLAALVKDHPEKYADIRLPYYKSDWRYAFDNKIPTPALVAQIDDTTLYRALEYLAEVLAVGEAISRLKSTWAWTLLALVEERGTLGYYREGKVRELGHKAGQLGIRLRNGEKKRVYVDAEGGAGESGAEEEDMGDEDGQGSDDEEDRGPLMDIGNQLDGSAEPNPAESAHPANNVAISDDEGEIQEDAPKDEEEPADLEAARARLLAQLGDNLVKESIPDRKVPAHQLLGKRHKHNGKVCRDPTCRVHRQAALQNAQDGKQKVATASSSIKSTQGVRLGANVQRGGAKTEKSSAGKSDMAVTKESKDGEEKQSQRAVSSSMQHDGAADSPKPTDNSPVPCDTSLEDEKKAILNTRVTVDMILTVVGDRYGQRDLLRFREVW